MNFAGGADKILLSALYRLPLFLAPGYRYTLGKSEIRRGEY
jgi:hypothetical protein